MTIPRPMLPLVLVAVLAPSAGASEPLACRMSALSPAARERYRILTAKMLAAVVAHDELADGYALDLDQVRVSLPELAEWVTLESRCCPFLRFGIDVAGQDGPLRLRLSGGEGVKEFIASELGWVP